MRHAGARPAQVPEVWQQQIRSPRRLRATTAGSSGASAQPSVPSAQTGIKTYAWPHLSSAKFGQTGTGLGEPAALNTHDVGFRREVAEKVGLGFDLGQMDSSQMVTSVHNFSIWQDGVMTDLGPWADRGLRAALQRRSSSFPADSL